MKKISTYLSLLFILSAVLVTPLTVIAEEVNNSENVTTQKQTEGTSISQYSDEEKSVQSSTLSEQGTSESASTDDSSTLKDTQTDEKQQSETTQSSVNQIRGPSISTYSKVFGSEFITDANLYDSKGNIVGTSSGNSNLTAKWDFKIPGGSNIQSGDTMVIDIPDILRLQKSVSFDILDIDGNIIGHAAADQKTKKVTITFTDYVEKHNENNIIGNFSIYTLWDADSIHFGQNNTVDWGFKQTIVYINPLGPDNRILTKAGILDSADDTKIKWTITLNKGKQEIKNAFLEDTFGKSQNLIPETLALVYFNADGTVQKRENISNSSKVITYDNKGLKIDFGDINQQIYLYYSTRATDGGASNSYTNSVKFTGDNIQDNILDAATPETGGTGTGYTLTDLTVKKIWDDNNNQDKVRPEKVEVQLYKNGVEEGNSVFLDSSNSWTTAFHNLDINAKYTAKEINVPDGYTANYDITIDSNGVGIITITNSHTPETTAIKGTKTWNDKDNQDGKRPDAITVNLLADGQPVDSKEVTSTDGWTYEFTNLPKYQNGQLINYTVTENEVSDYSTTIDGTNITNSYTPGKTSVTVTKAWDDKNNQDGLRPGSIQVQLYADGKAVGAAIDLTENKDWTYTWSDLDQKASGKTIVYTVKELTAVEGYTTSIDDSEQGNVVITNSHTPETTAIKGTKTWNDKDNQDGKRPDTITVNLLADGKAVDSKEVTSTDGWTYEFTNLPKYQNGQLINYTVTENEVSDYSTTIDGTNITNSYTPGKTSVTVTKAWDDKNNQDGLRPGSIQVQLYADGKAVGAAIDLTENKDWTYTWSDLDQKASGKTIVYTVKELTAVEGYTTSIDDSEQGNVVITNSHTPETTAIKGTKTWNDKDNQDGKRPDTITVNLLADGQPVDSKEVTSTDGWTYEFTNLPKYQNGQLINYTVTENEVSDYSTTIDGTNITNSYTPGKTSVTVTKAWDDKNNQDGLRPGSIQVQLYADGKAVGAAIDLTENKDWTYTWSDLDQKASGKTIVYTVKELTAVEGYKTSIDDSEQGNVVITNSHTPETTAIKGTKTWNDKDNQDGKRPDTITVNLLADGKAVDSKEVTSTDGWTYEFTNLPKYQNGQLINYTVTENEVSDYSTTIDGTNITNSYTPGKTSVTVTKAWNDKNNQDGLRPGSIQVQLYADGKAVGEAIDLTENKDWTYTWSDLDQKASGKTIVYTVKELTAVKGYTTSIDDSEQGNVIITNNHTPETTAIKGTKIWNDKDNQDGKRPDTITVNLLADGKAVDSKEVTSTDGWTYEFTNLPKYQNGQLINYTVTENEVSDYSTTIDGTNITNSYTPGKTSVTVTKAWNDKNNQDGLRPGSIQVQLYADGKAVGEAIDLTENKDWTYTWSDLDQKASGKTIVYTVKELTAVEGYTTSIDDSEQGNVVITNNHTPETTAIKGTKTWNDKDNQDGKRPDAITVNLLADGQPVDSKEVTSTDGWTYEFTNLPKYQNGQLINYTVTENEVSDYSTTIDGTNITNSYTPGKTSVTVTKAWNDKNNQDGLRPGSIQVQLYADGKAVGEAIDLTENKDWTYTWSDLDQKASGKTIVYTVKELTAVEGYTTSIDDSEQGNVIITNSHTPEKVNTELPPKKPNNGGMKENTHSNKKDRFLPNTGEERKSLLTLIGILILGFVIFIVIKKKKINSKY
ncbi:Cna B-type domain-containing protein (plasmid) [Enterococcus faecalis]|uniref:Cna B-type domain-containing protein n=6 Tax=Lactobacillales TaxID=186826 RepID=UPI001D0A384D|nr:Cna B-type domain-containing protein [Enterococcus faecalis]UDM48173.1 Cna B-type domain-containing protein [Enterococcus faecalis]